MEIINEKIPVAGPSITQHEINYVRDAVQNAWYQNANIYNEKFEKAFAEYLGAKHVMALPSCTSAIHLSLLALGIGPGDEVIVPEITWIATSAPINYVGATPVFADIESKTWCLSPDSFEKSITSKTKAVIPVDLYGNMPEFDQINKIASKYGITVIEDAAEAIGSEYRGKKAGTLGHLGVFSFHGSKTLTTGEGGMLVTNDKKLFERALVLRDHGRHPGDFMFFNHEVGYKYKMSSMQAALGLAQLERVEELVDKKREIFSWYFSELNSIPGVIFNFENSHTKNSYWMTTAVFNEEIGITKEDIIAESEKYNISLRPFFYPLSSLPAYSNKDVNKFKKNNVIAYRTSPYGINLPSYLNIEYKDVKYVCDFLKFLIGDEN